MNSAVRRALVGVAALAAFWSIGDGAWAQEDWFTGNWHMWTQEAVTPVMDQLSSLHKFLFILIMSISLFVLALLIYVMIRFNKRSNPVPSRTSHNTLVEVMWTVVPVLILAVIAIPSLRLLYAQDTIPKVDMTIKATGYQWYWGYEYPDHGGFAFDAIMLEDDQRGPNDPRLLAVDNPVVVPVDTTVRVLVTAADVLHSFAMPPFGIKIDAVPGRLNETWFRARQEGTYYGQCSELCGIRHAFMPIRIDVVSKEKFAAWVADAQQRFARADGREAVRLASAPQN